MKVGIQGVRACFHDVAARKFFASQAIVPIECPTFKALAQSLRDGESDLCMMAIENSIAGSILPNYTLLETHGFKIVGEVYLRIEMSIMALAGQRLEDIRWVRSHPMALLQCEDFLAAHPWMKALEGTDTAESARDIQRDQTQGTAAIASRLAAEAYGLELLGEGIESNKRNYTRFLAIARREGYVADPRSNKASIRFEVVDKPGALARVLTIFNELSVNMTKIQSIPILGRPYEYSFHVDLEWEDPTRYREAMSRMRADVVNMIHFGEYVRNERPSQ